MNECDILIGIFWKRFGTPTNGADSGTEHEILLAYDVWKKKKQPHIMVYFNQQSPPTLTEIDPKQLERVQRCNFSAVNDIGAGAKQVSWFLANPLYSSLPQPL